MIKQEKWDIEIPAGSNGWVYITRDNGLYKENVCTIHGNIRGVKKEGELVDSVAKQDARMIAAAPEMYALLREVVNCNGINLAEVSDILNQIERDAKL
jgi:hypothetical protein